MQSRTWRAASSAGSPSAQTCPLTTRRLTASPSRSADRDRAAATRRVTVDLPAPGAPVTSRQAAPAVEGASCGRRPSARRARPSAARRAAGRRRGWRCGRRRRAPAGSHSPASASAAAVRRFSASQFDSGWSQFRSRWPAWRRTRSGRGGTRRDQCWIRVAVGHLREAARGRRRPSGSGRAAATPR